MPDAPPAEMRPDGRAERRKAAFAAPDFSGLERPLLIVSIDTEEDFDWSAPFAANSQTVTSMRCQHLAQRVFDRHGVVPIYLCDFPIADQADAYSILREWRQAGTCAVGTQLHTWVNPPHREVVNQFNSYPSNLPIDLVREKLRILTERIEETIGERPVVYKAGRNGAAREVEHLVKPLGYSIDMSFNPTRSYARQEGPDQTVYPHAPFWLDAEKELLSIPLSTDVLGLLRRHWMQISETVWGAASERMHLPGILRRLGLLNRITLTPEGVSLTEAQKLTRAMMGFGHRVFCLSYHSPSLQPGSTPYVRSDADLRRFLAWLEDYLQFFLGTLGGRCVTPMELLGQVRQMPAAARG